MPEARESVVRRCTCDRDTRINDPGMASPGCPVHAPSEPRNPTCEVCGLPVTEDDLRSGDGYIHGKNWHRHRPEGCLRALGRAVAGLRRDSSHHESRIDK